MQCYLDAMATAYRGWRGRAIERGLVGGGVLASEQLARICYHVPFCKMARKAHVQVRRCDRPPGHRGRRRATGSGFSALQHTGVQEADAG